MKRRITYPTILIVLGIGLVQFYQNCSPSKDSVGDITGPTSTKKFQVSIDPIPTGGIIKGGKGLILCGDTDDLCDVKIGSGDRLALTAEPLTGMKFDGWSGSCGFAAKSTTCNLTVTRNMQVAANFSPNNVANSEVNVTARIIGNGSLSSTPSGLTCTAGQSTCSKRFTAGQEVTLVAVPATGYEVQTWSTNTSCLQGRTTCKFTPSGASASMDVSVTFTTISSTPSPGPSGTTSPSPRPSPSPGLSTAPSPQPSQILAPELDNAGTGHYNTTIWTVIKNVIPNVTSLDFRLTENGNPIGTISPGDSAYAASDSIGVKLYMPNAPEALRNPFFFGGGAWITPVNGPGKYGWPPKLVKPVTIAADGTQDPWIPLRSLEVKRPWVGTGGEGYPCAIWILGGNLQKTEVRLFQGGPARSDGNSYSEPQTETELGKIENKDLSYNASPMADKPLLQSVTFNIPNGSLASEYKAYGLWVLLRDVDTGTISNWIKLDPGPAACDAAPEPSPILPPFCEYQPYRPECYLYQ